MAVATQFNVHPDETWHFGAAGYFMSGLVPPRLNDPAIAHTISSYGHSYLKDAEPGYILAGRFMAATDALFGSMISLPIAYRLFQLLCFACLLCWITARGMTRLPLLLLCSAQIWYVFSYANGDAFAFMLAAILAVEFGASQGAIRRALVSGGIHHIVPLLLGGVGCGLLFASKKNYWVMLVFYAVLVAIAVTPALWKRNVIALARPVLLGAVFLGTMWLARGFESLRVPEVKEAAPVVAAAHPVDLADLATKQFLKGKGAELGDVLWGRDWAWLSSSSFMGQFGWMSVQAPPWYSVGQLALWVILMLVIFVRAARAGTWEAWALCAGAALTIVGCVGVSMYWSWFVDFQPQGRYLFPIIIVLGILWERTGPPRRDSDLRAICMLLYALALLLFIFGGLQSVDSAYTGKYF
jgi:hypothetical protein